MPSLVSSSSQHECLRYLGYPKSELGITFANLKDAQLQENDMDMDQLTNLLDDFKSGKISLSDVWDQLDQLETPPEVDDDSPYVDDYCGAGQPYACINQ